MILLTLGVFVVTILAIATIAAIIIAAITGALLPILLLLGPDILIVWIIISCCKKGHKK